MKKIGKEVGYIFLSMIISFFIYRFITINFLEYVPFNPYYRSLVYIGTVLFQGILIYIIIKARVDNTISKKNIKILWFQYLFCVLFLLFGRGAGVRGINLNLIIAIKEIFNDSYNVVIAIANILMFLPCGYLFKGKKTLKSIFIMLIVLVGIESLQYIFSRGMFDIGDITLNIFGFYCGFLIFNNRRCINKLDKMKIKFLNNTTE